MKPEKFGKYMKWYYLMENSEKNNIVYYVYLFWNIK